MKNVAVFFLCFFGFLGVSALFLGLFGDHVTSLTIEVSNKTKKDIFFYVDVTPMPNNIEPVGRVSRGTTRKFVIPEFNTKRHAVYDFGFNERAFPKKYLSVNGSAIIDKIGEKGTLRLSANDGELVWLDWVPSESKNDQP